MSTESPRPQRRPVRGGASDASSAGEPQKVVPVEPSAEPAPVEEAVEAQIVPAPEPEAEMSSPLPEPEPVPAPVFEPEPTPAPVFEPEPDTAPAEPVTAPAVEARDEADEPEMAPLAAATEAPKSKGKFPRPGKKPKTTDGEASPLKQRSYNPKRKSLIITGSVVGGIVLVLGFSVYKVAQAPSAEDMVGIYQQQSGDYGFPVDKGQDAAIRFLSLYLNTPEDAALRTQNKALLDAMLIGAIAPIAPSGVSQRVVSGPTPAGLMSQTDAGSANQRYTALVETTVKESQPGTDINGDPLPEKTTKTLQEVTYRVNLVVDPTGTTVLIAGNPTLLPNTVVASEMKILPPPEAPDGSFSGEITDSLVKPFFKVWAASDNAAIKSWLATGASGQWTQGLGGTQTMGNVTVAAPLGVKGNGSGDISAQVEWIAPDGTRQTSTYTLGVVYENSRWLVSNLT